MFVIIHFMSELSLDTSCYCCHAAFCGGSREGRGLFRQHLVYELLGRIDFQWAIGRCKV